MKIANQELKQRYLLIFGGFLLTLSQLLIFVPNSYFSRSAKIKSWILSVNS